MQDKKNKELDNKKITFIVFVVIAFLLLVAGGFSLIIGATINETRLIYLGITLLSIGFVLYIILFFILAFKFIKSNSNKE